MAFDFTALRWKNQRVSHRSAPPRTLHRRFFGVFCVAAVVLGCEPRVQVKTAHDPGAPFESYKTFSMLQPNRPVHSENTEVDPFVLQRLRQLTYLRLKAQGLRPANKSKADLLVGVIAGKNEQLHFYSTYSRDPWGGPYGYGFGSGFSNTQVMRIREGSVVIDLIDRKENSVVWRGTGIRATQRGIGEEEARHLVNEILERSPVMKAKK